MASIPSRIAGYVSNAGSLLYNAGINIINGLLRGIVNAVTNVYNYVSGIAAGIAARKGPLPKDRKLLEPAGQAIIGGLLAGLQQQVPDMYRFVSGIAPQLQSLLSGVDGEDAGQQFGRTVAAGIESSTRGVTDAAAKMAQSATRSAQDALGRIDLSDLVVGGDGASLSQALGRLDVSAQLSAQGSPVVASADPQVAALLRQQIDLLTTQNGLLGDALDRTGDVTVNVDAVGDGESVALATATALRREMLLGAFR